MMSREGITNYLIAAATFLALFGPHPAAGQLLSFGVKGGVPLTDATEGNFSSPAMKRYVVGPTAELKLPFSFAFEADALYRRTGYDLTVSNFGLTSVTQVRANSWEFPLLVKHYMGPSLLPLRLYLSGGYVVRKTSGVDGSVHTFGTDSVSGQVIDTTVHYDGSNLRQDDPTHGLAVGGGARLHLGPLHISPEIRYTRWTGIGLNDQQSHGVSAQSTQNQVDLLVGLTF
ncbi:MAG: outer membrane beta-barrel protein [Acidobacteriales bacterium]|nr:outer membrane beta-barrel protein [Terriglobales bacterium]